MTDFTYTQAKAIIKEIGKYEIEDYSHYGLTIINPINGAKYEAYAIGTEDEADEAWEEALESYYDECVEPEVPDWLVNYIDYDKWKYDAKMDGRGHVLSGYDGCETGVADLVMFRIN